MKAESFLLLMEWNLKAGCIYVYSGTYLNKPSKLKTQQKNLHNQYKKCSANRCHHSLKEKTSILQQKSDQKYQMSVIEKFHCM